MQCLRLEEKQKYAELLQQFTSMPAVAQRMMTRTDVHVDENWTYVCRSLSLYVGLCKVLYILPTISLLGMRVNFVCVTGQLQHPAFCPVDCRLYR
jgi:hypothetical protein